MKPDRIFDVNFFLKYFEAIPDKQWCAHHLDDGNGAHCALGHLGVRNADKGCFVNFGTMGRALVQLFESHDLRVTDINDWQRDNRAATPKARILEALRFIKSKQLPTPPALVLAPAWPMVAMQVKPVEVPA